MRGTVRNVWLRVVVALALAPVLVGGMAATVHASPTRGALAGPQPYPVTCEFKHWGIFASAESSKNGYIVDVYDEGEYDNSTGVFCGPVRGHVAVTIPAFHVGGATTVSFSCCNLSSSGTAPNAGSSSYVYNLYTGTTDVTSCGFSHGTFLPTGGNPNTDLVQASTANVCA